MKLPPKRTARTALAAATVSMLITAACTGTASVPPPTPTTQPAARATTAEPAHAAQHADAVGSGPVEMPHIHGLGFSPDGRQLVVPAHDGLRIYAEGQWSTPAVPAHDYMGFVPSDDGFYSSGHPDPASTLVNPLGLIKSVDGGKTLVRLGFEGESDFHMMAVGYANHTIYVGNPAPNSALQPGIYYSLDEGQTWQQSALQGVTASPIQIAVHPVDANVVALATEAGLLLSTDFGNTFTPAGEEGTVTAVTFHPEGQTLLFGYQALYLYDLASQQVTALSPPTIAPEDAISYIAVNPVNPDVIALATFARDIYLSEDGGQTWRPIVQAGAGIDLE